MSSIATWTRRHRLVAFFGLTFLLSWWSWPFYAVDLAPTAFFPCGPLVAALVVIGVADGRAGYRDLGARMIRWRVGWTWWLVAVGTPLGGPGRRRGRERRALGCARAGPGRDGVVAARAGAPRSGSSTRSTARWARSPAGAATRSRSCRPGAHRSRSGLVLAPVRRALAPAAGGDGPAPGGRPADHLRHHAGLRLAVQPHRRQRADDDGLPHRAGHRQLRRARLHRGRRGAHGLARRGALVRPRRRGDRARPAGLADGPGGRGRRAVRRRPSAAR